MRRRITMSKASSVLRRVGERTDELDPLEDRTPSILVLKCGKAFSFASPLRQSYSLPQYRTSSWSFASCTPCDVIHPFPAFNRVLGAILEELAAKAAPQSAARS
jgi:hypothetical protein